MGPSKKKSNTCLAVLRDKEGKLWFAGDRRVSWDMSKAIKGPRAKIAKRNGVLLAGTGVSSICDEIVDLLSIPRYNSTQSVFHYMNRNFLDAVLKHLSKRKLLHKEERRLVYKEGKKEAEDGEWFGAIILVGFQGELFELDVDNHHIAIGPIDAPYAHGCGGDYALGSLLTTEDSKLNPKTRLIRALNVAARMSPGCGDGIDILTED